MIVIVHCNFQLSFNKQFLSRDIDIAIPSVCYVSVFYGNGYTLS